MLWRSASREAGDGEVGRTPEKVYRAAFADEARAESGEDALALHEDAPEPVGVLGVVRTVNFILIERNRVGNFIGIAVDRHRQAEPLQLVHQPRVEPGDGPRLQRETT